MSKKALLLFVLSASFGFAQLDSNSITVTASRTATLQPDQAVFSVSVQSDVNTSLDDVVAALQGSGITAANFVGVSTSSLIFIPVGTLPVMAPTIQWTFSLPVALTKTKDTVATLTALQKTISQKNASLNLSFSIQGTQVSQQLLQSQTCSIPDLLTNAQAQAQTLASAAGVTLGAVLAMSSPTSSVPIANAAFASGSYISLTAYSPAPCTLTVKFAVTRFQ